MRWRLSLGDRAAITFLALGALLCGLAISTDAADGWASNLAAEALGIAATVAIVERVFRVEERRRRAPRVEPVIEHMGIEFMRFVSYVAQDYSTTHRQGVVSQDAFVLLDAWLRDQESADAPHAHLDPWDPDRPQHTLREHGWDFAYWVGRAEERDRDLLEPDLVAAVRALHSSVRSSRQALGAAREFGGPQGLVDHFERHSFRTLVARTLFWQRAAGVREA